VSGLALHLHARVTTSGCKLKPTGGVLIAHPTFRKLSNSSPVGWMYRFELDDPRASPSVACQPFMQSGSIEVSSSILSLKFSIHLIGPLIQDVLSDDAFEKKLVRVYLQRCGMVLNFLIGQRLCRSWVILLVMTMPPVANKIHNIRLKFLVPIYSQHPLQPHPLNHLHCSEK